MKAKYLRGMLAALLLLLPAAAMADSITPSSVTASLGIGETLTVAKTVTIAKEATTSQVDVYFMADTTGSMGGTIAAVSGSASSILSTTAAYGSVNFAVGEYKDSGDTYAYRLNTAMTSSQATAQAGINLWSAGGGGDYQEANLYALSQAASDVATGWRAGSAKIMVWFGDASGHDPSIGGVTEASATAALVAQNIKVEAIDVGSLNDTGQAQRIATATGGDYYAGIDSATIAQKIIDAIGSIVNSYSTVSLDTSEVPAGVGVSVAPGSYTGSFDRSIERTFGFDVTFTGLASGDYSFNIYALLDTGRVATESDRIRVVDGTSVPEPATLLLIGFGLLGLTGVQRRMKK